MSQVAKIEFDVSANGIKKSLVDMFDGAASVLREAAQNAHRAGASKFEITTNTGGCAGQQIELSNDGSVMHDLDWKRLFHVGTSGWDEATMNEENPFGIGSTSMLFCSTQIVVHSGYAVATIDSGLFFNGTPVDVQIGHEYFNGTRFVLDIKPTSWEDLKLYKLNETFDAFPIPVFFNGNAIQQRFAFSSDGLQLYPFEYGHVAIARDLGRHCSFSMLNRPRLFAQGLPTSSPADTRHRSVHVGAVVHLDVTKVRPSVPDRTRLVDPPANLKKLANEAIKEGLRDLLLIEAEKVGVQRMLIENYKLGSYILPELFENFDAPLPEDSFFTLDDQLIDWPEDEFEERVTYRGSSNKFVGANTLGEGYLVYEGHHNVNPIQSIEAQLFNFAFKNDMLILDGRNIIQNHAVNSHAINTDEIGRFVVTGSNLSEESQLKHEGLQFLIVFHDGIAVNPPALNTMSGNQVQWDSAYFTEKECFFANSTYYVGRKCSSAGWLAAQLSSFSVNVDSDWYERDEEAEGDSVNELSRLIQVLRGDSNAKVLAEMLNSHYSELCQMSHHLAEKSFTVTFDQTGSATFTEI